MLPKKVPKNYFFPGLVRVGTAPSAHPAHPPLVVLVSVYYSTRILSFRAMHIVEA